MNSNWNYPTTMWVGKDRIKDLSTACKTLNINKPLLVTDSGLAKSKIVIDVLNNLKEDGITAELYSDVVGNPTGTNVTDGADYYNNDVDIMFSQVANIKGVRKPKRELKENNVVIEVRYKKNGAGELWRSIPKETRDKFETTVVEDDKIVLHLKED